MLEFILNLNYTGVILLIFGFISGIKFPDIDIKMKFISHRSILTHSPFLSILMYLISRKIGTSDFNYFLSAFSLSEGIHLIYDFFPKAWIGTALIKIPPKSGFGAKTSKYFIFLSIVILMFIGINLMETLSQLKLSMILSIIILIIFHKKEGEFIKPLIVFTFLYLVIAYIFFPFLFFELKTIVIENLKSIHIFK